MFAVCNPRSLSSHSSVQMLEPDPAVSLFHRTQSLRHCFQAMARTAAHPKTHGAVETDPFEAVDGMEVDTLSAADPLDDHDNSDIDGSPMSDIETSEAEVAIAMTPASKPGKPTATPFATPATPQYAASSSSGEKQLQEVASCAAESAFSVFLEHWKTVKENASRPKPARKLVCAGCETTTWSEDAIEEGEFQKWHFYFKPKKSPAGTAREPCGCWCQPCWDVCDDSHLATGTRPGFVRNNQKQATQTYSFLNIEDREPAKSD